MTPVVIFAIDSRTPAFFLSPPILDEFETKSDGIRCSQLSQYSPRVLNIKSRGRDSHYGLNAWD
jgi:hypothetical protein